MNWLARVSPGEWLVFGAMMFGTFVVLLPMGWAIVRKLNYLADVFKEYPPHRHINGNILYPKEFSPGRVELNAD